MKRFAVGYMDYFYNDLIVEIVEADNWFNALKKHSSFLKKQKNTFLRYIQMISKK